MAKKTNKQEVQEGLVFVPDLAEEFDLTPAEIRRVLRAAGLRAPETKVEGFGPRAKYQWEQGSKGLKQVKAVLEEYLTPEEPEEEEEEVISPDEEIEELEKLGEPEEPEAKKTKKARK